MHLYCFDCLRIELWSLSKVSPLAWASFIITKYFNWTCRQNSMKLFLTYKIQILFNSHCYKSNNKNYFDKRVLFFIEKPYRNNFSVSCARPICPSHQTNGGRCDNSETKQNGVLLTLVHMYSDNSLTYIKRYDLHDGYQYCILLILTWLTTAVLYIFTSAILLLCKKLLLFSACTLNHIKKYFVF